MKIDLKTILLIVFFVLSLFFGYSWYSSRRNSPSEKINTYINDIKKLEDEKIVYKKELSKLNVEYITLEKKDKELCDKIDELNKKLYILENDANLSKDKFKKLQKELYDTRMQIEKFEKNPPNRTGNLLLESIKNKTK